ncbi:MAG: cation transporter [Flavobacterium sp.]|nr:cation transporter [Flavobacterium sp.]
MAHNHTHSRSTTTRLTITILLNFLTSLAEIIGGILSGTLSLISDALHNFSDGISVIISFIALKLKSRDNSIKHTFGLKRAEILAAVINAAILITIYIFLFYEAVQRIYRPSQIEPQLMMIIAAIGLAANIAGTLLLKKDAGKSLNIKSSYFHLLSDAFSSVAVIIGGAAIYFWKIYWLDPVLTILIGIYILRECIIILGEAIHILMEGAPLNISIDDVQKTVEEFEEVKDIHHIHLWMVGDNDIHFEAHININDMKISESDDLRKRIENELELKFGMHHITLQFECNQCLESGILGRH